MGEFNFNLVEKLAEQLSSHTIGFNLFIILIITCTLSLISRFALYRLNKSAQKSETFWDESIYDSMGPPLRLLIWVLGLSFMLDLILIYLESSYLDSAESLEKIMIIVSFAWFLLRLIRNVAHGYQLAKKSKQAAFDHSATEAVSKLLRVVVFVAATLAILQSAGISIAGILTFGGIGGIAVGFAAKDMLANFFGGFMIYLDRPFATGDWVRSPDREIEGTVEQIGWRMTKIRNFESRPLYVPNSLFSTISIENVSRMTNRRIYETIGIRYADSEAVNSIVDQVTEYLKSHPDIDQDQSLIVNFTTFAPSSLDFFVYCFTKTRIGLEFYQTKQKIMLDIYQIIEDNGAECAFPTTTIHLQGGSISTDEDKEKTS